MILDQFLEKRGVKVEDLVGEELNVYTKMLETLESRPITIEDVKMSIRKAREEVSRELVETDEYEYVLWFRVVNRKHVGLKARLKNYLLLEAFMQSKEAAKKELEKYIQSQIR